MTEKRLHIDWTACAGRGHCVELLPELLDVDDWGYPVPRDGERNPTIPSTLLANAAYAVTSCPRLALSLLQR
jgi:ferredoxin